MTTDELKKQLNILNMRHLSANLDDFIAKATKNRLSPLAILEQVTKLELEESKRRSVESRLRSSRVNERKWRPIEDFDWNWPKTIDRLAVENLLSLAFLEEPANAILVGPSSLGKTMIARNLVYKAVMAGKNAIIIEAVDLIRQLEEIDSARTLRSRLQYFGRPSLLVIDEIGYLSYSQRAGDLLFQLISHRYEKTSTVVTTNLAFKDWGTIFPAAACVSALLERLLHRAEIISITGDSYRMKEADERKGNTKGKRKESAK